MVPIVPPLRSVQAVRLNRTRSIVQQFTSSKEDMPNGELPRFENSRNVEMIEKPARETLTRLS
jgi:hypothetical protein